MLSSRDPLLNWNNKSRSFLFTLLHPFFLSFHFRHTPHPSPSLFSTTHTHTLFPHSLFCSSSSFLRAMPADPCCIMCCSTVDGTGVLNSCQHFLCSRCFGKFGTNPRLPPPNNNWCPRCKAGCKTIPLNAPTFPKHILDQISSDPAADLKATLAAVEFQSAADKAIVVRLKELVQALNTSNTNYRTKTAALEAKLAAAEKEAAELRQRCQQLEAAAAAGGGCGGFGGGALPQQPYPHHQQHHPHHGSLPPPPPPPPQPHQQQHSYGAPSLSMAPMSVPMASAGARDATPGMGSATGGPNPLATPILMGYLSATPQAAGAGSSSYPQQHHNHPPQAMGGGAPLSSAQTSMAPHSSMQSVSMPPQGGPSSVSPAPNHHHLQPMGNGQLHHQQQQQYQQQQQHPYGNGISPGAAAAVATGGGLPSSASVSVSPAGWGGSAKKRERDGDANASAHQQPSTSPAMVSAAAVRCNGSALMELATIVQQQQQGQQHQQPHHQQHTNNGVVGGPHGGGVAMPPQTPAGQVYNLRALTERGGGGARGTSADANNIKNNGGSNGGGVRGGNSANIAGVAPQAMGLDQGRLLHQLRASGNGSANRRGSGSAGGGVASGGPSSSSAQHHQQQAAYGGHRAPSLVHHPNGAAAGGGSNGKGGGGKLTIGNLAAHNVRLASVMR